MIKKDKYKYTTYLAGAIEAVSKKVMKSWRDEISQKLDSNDLLIYDPVKQENYKVGKTSHDQVDYIKGLKKSGNYDLFFKNMWRIWFGAISPNTDLTQLLTNLRMRKHIDGNRLEDIKHWGDAEAVVRSDFIVVYMPKKVKTVGTIYELTLAFLYRIPVYLILPDAPKTETNSSLLFGVQISGGEIFYTVNDCIDFVKDRYNLKIKEKKGE